MFPCKIYFFYKETVKIDGTFPFQYLNPNFPKHDSTSSLTASQFTI